MLYSFFLLHIAVFVCAMIGAVGIALLLYMDSHPAYIISAQASGGSEGDGPTQALFLFLVEMKGAFAGYVDLLFILFEVLFIVESASNGFF